MQQFTVPQFIDVESKIIGPITVRQFMIILVATIFIALCYPLFDFTLFVFIAVIVAIIAFIFCFIKINGRPFHLFVLNLFQTLRRPRLRVWNNRLMQTVDYQAPEIKKNVDSVVPQKIYKKSHLAELALIVDTKGHYQGK